MHLCPQQLRRPEAQGRPPAALAPHLPSPPSTSSVLPLWLLPPPFCLLSFPPLSFAFLVSFSIFPPLARLVSISPPPGPTCHAPQPPGLPPSGSAPRLGRGGDQASSAQGALGVLLVTGFQVGAGGLAAVSLGAERRARGGGGDGWLGSQAAHCRGWGDPPSREASRPHSAQRNRLTARRPPDLSKMSRARELKAWRGAGRSGPGGGQARRAPSPSRGGGRGTSPRPHSCWIWRSSRKIGFRAPEPAVGGAGRRLEKGRVPRASAQHGPRGTSPG